MRLFSNSFTLALTTLAFMLLVTAATSATEADDTTLPVRTEQTEQIPGVTTLYRSVPVDADTRLRVFITRPDNLDGPLNPLFLTQWVSCGPLHYERGGSMSETLAMLARDSGLSLVRVERSGSGDSTGVPCSELDYDTEVAHYRAAFQQVLESADVDSSRVFFLGLSLGSTTAPLLAQHFQDEGYELGGIAVQGGGAYSYLERMLAFEQNYLDRRPDSPNRDSRTSQYGQRAAFLVEYLLKQRHPDDIAADSEAMAAVRNDILGMDETSHYGRPFQWHQQAAQHDFVAAWRALAAPVAVVFNEYDQYEAIYGAELLVDTVNSEGRGTAELIFQSGLGHSSGVYRDTIDAYAGRDGVKGWPRTAGQLTAWFYRHRNG